MQIENYSIVHTIILYTIQHFYKKHIKKSKIKFKLKIMKIFKNNLKKNTQIISLRNKIGDVGKTKYFPSFTKEWKNTIYSFNKNIIKNIPVNFLNLNKIIKSYFNLYFKNPKFLDKLENKGLLLRKRRNLLRRIFVSDAEIKHTNNKAVITLYIVNREKRILTKKFLKINKLISKLLFNRCYNIYRYNISEIYTTLNKFKNEDFLNKKFITKRNFVNFKLANLNTFIKLKHLYLKRIWSILLKKYSLGYLRIVRKLHLTYSLNQYKLNKLFLLPKLSNILTKILGKKIEYNLINLKSIAYNTDIFTNVLALKLKNKKNYYGKVIPSILNRAHLPVINTIMERTFYKKENIQSKNLKIISHLSDNNNLDILLNKTYDINYDSKNKTKHSLVYNSIGYKNMGGIRLEIKGRLTKRYRADRSIYFVKWKGGLKNIDSSFQRLSSVLFRGNTNSNSSYSLYKGKRRIGAFAVKGWIGGK